MTRKTFVWIDGQMYEKGQEPQSELPYIMGDIPGYISPTTGLWVEGRRARAEDLKRSGCRPWEGMKAERQEAERQKQYQVAAQEKALDRAVWTTWYQMNPDKRRLLRS